MTDPIRTALEALVDATRTYLHAMYPSGTGHPADAIGADMERAYRAARAVLATPPASPVIRHGDEHDDPDGYCATCESLRIGPYAPPASPEPHRYSPDAMAMGDCKVCGRIWEDHQPPTPPEGAEALLLTLANAKEQLERLCPDLMFENGGDYYRWETRLEAYGDAYRAAARATPPLTVEALCAAIGKVPYRVWDADDVPAIAAAILAALEQDR